MKTTMYKGNLIVDERFYSREPLGTEHDMLVVAAVRKYLYNGGKQMKNNNRV